MTRNILIVSLVALILAFAGCKRQVPEPVSPEQANGTDQTTLQEQADSQPQAGEEQPAAEEPRQPGIEEAQPAQEPAQPQAVEEQTAEPADKEADTVQHTGINWYTDLEAAMKKAEEESKDLFINFSGSDWCYWCQRLDEEVLSRPAFYEEATKQFVFVLVDFPSDDSKLTEEQKQKNRQLLGSYGVQGFPTIILAGPGGKGYAMTGYQEGGPEAYLKQVLQMKQEKGS